MALPLKNTDCRIVPFRLFSLNDYSDLLIVSIGTPLLRVHRKRLSQLECWKETSRRGMFHDFIVIMMMPSNVQYCLIQEMLLAHSMQTSAAVMISFI
ncbi:hypothetical protein LSH36_399g02054 [Paralvinella palmiformis]|uniref:Uncharacterized protein n=1 Tax=Paralvinella palmiformis TaxID=53620 RepID=A0AAD9MYW8_9ANNE|nr:hypothetical protein LSH36_399g02054 [Paralvinella palmiformis]